VTKLGGEGTIEGVGEDVGTGVDVENGVGEAVANVGEGEEVGDNVSAGVEVGVIVGSTSANTPIRLLSFHPTIPEVGSRYAKSATT
jgi:hypothetical protein